MEDVREKHGVLHDVNSVVITERGDCISIYVFKGDGAASSTTIFVTPNEARHLATKLKRLARRIDDRILGR